MTEADIGSVPILHQGDADEVRARIRDLGSSAILAFQGDQHVGQLQFRRYEAGTRSSNGVWDPLWWMDFGRHGPAMPSETLCAFCYHVGQLDDTAGRDERYQGRGIATQLLDTLVEWSRAAGFAAVIAKATARFAGVTGYLGGLPWNTYETRGFEKVDSWMDADLARVVREHGLATPADVSIAARVACCVRRLA